MKNFGKIFFCVGLFLFFIDGYALGNIHYVTQTGGGGGISADEFNALSGDRSGHTFYFSGTISSQLVINVYGSPNNPVTLDGWANGICNPTENGTCAGAATLTGGISQLNANTTHTRHLIIQDFNITTKMVYLGWRSWHTPPSHITARRNNFNDQVSTALNFGTPDWIGRASYITVEGNRFGNYGLTIDTSEGVNFWGIDDLIVRGNRFTGHNGVAQSSNAIEMHSIDRGLVEYNWWDENLVINQGNSGNLAIKEHGNWNIIYRFNKSYAAYRAHSAVGFNWFISSNFYAYCNLIYGNGVDMIGASGGRNYDGANNANWWSNIFRDFSNAGYNGWWQTDRGAGVDPGTKRLTNIKFYNNTVYGNATNTHSSAGRDQTGFSLSDTGASDVYVKNNIFANNRPNSSDRRQVYDANNRITQLEHNTYYHTNGEPTVWRDGAHRTIGTLQSTYNLENASPSGLVTNPGFVDASTRDLRLNGTHIDNGANLSGIAGTITIQGVPYNMLWETALHPNTDWRGQPSPSKIITANQNDYGSGWERGAYVFAHKVNHLNSPNNVRILSNF